MRKLTRDELVRESEIKKRDGFDAVAKTRYGDLFTLTTITRFKRSSQEEDDTFDLPSDEIYLKIPEADIVDAQGKTLHPSSASDMLMNDEVLQPQGEYARMAKVIIRNVELYGKVI